MKDVILANLNFTVSYRESTLKLRFPCTSHLSDLPEQPTPTPTSGKLHNFHRIKSDIWLLHEFSISRYFLGFS